MKSYKIRLHKAIGDLVRSNKLEYTNAEIQKNIEVFGVYYNGNLIYKRLEWILNLEGLNISHWPKRDKGNTKDIKPVLEESDYLVIFKPYNLVVSPGAGHKEDNLVYWLSKHYPEQKLMLQTAPISSNAKISAGLVHRLDKNTQGVLLIARNHENLKHFQDQFKNREVQKKYLAVLNGHIDRIIEVSAFQARSKKDPLKQKIFWTQIEAQNYDINFKNNESIFHPIAYCPETNQTLVEVEIKTGRMHQIRLQAEAIGHPLCCDPVYNQTPLSVPKLQSQEKNVLQVNKNTFTNIKLEIFGDYDFCLLSNYLKLKALNGKELIVEYKKVDIIIDTYVS